MNKCGYPLRLVGPNQPLLLPNDHVINGMQDILIAKHQWNAGNFNSKALNAIFKGVSPEEFRRISSVEVAKPKTTWSIPKITREGNKAVKASKLKMLTYRFEEIRIQNICTPINSAQSEIKFIKIQNYKKTFLLNLVNRFPHLTNL